MQKITNIKKIYAINDLKIQLKQINKFKNANIFSLIGEKYCGKKHLIKYVLNKWENAIYLIQSENENFENKIEKIKKLIKNNTSRKSFIINHPEKLSLKNQKTLLGLIEENIASEHVKWVAIIINESNITTLLLERIKTFQIKIPKLNERLSDIKKLTKYFENKYKNSKKPKIILNASNYKNFQTLKRAIKIHYTQPNEYSFNIDAKFTKMNIKQATDIFQKIYLTKIINKHKSINEASKIAQIDRTTIYRKLN